VAEKKDENWKPNLGDVVKLKSGGPDMTVIRTDDSAVSGAPIRCQWFAGKRLEQGTFRVSSLVPVVDEV
jgi:uncharacterized protein YodC (DUF2158 family)